MTGRTGVPKRGDEIRCVGEAEHLVLVCIQDVDMAVPISRATFQRPDGTAVPEGFLAKCPECGMPWIMRDEAGKVSCLNIHTPPVEGRDMNSQNNEALK